MMLRACSSMLKRLKLTNGPPRVPSHMVAIAHSTSSTVLTNQLIPERMSEVSTTHEYKFYLEKPHLDDRQENRECIDKPTSETTSIPFFDDYFLCLKHNVGDFDPIPKDLQMKIRDFAVNTFIPDVLHYLGTKHPKFCKYSVDQVELNGFEFKSGMLRGFITNEERYDLEKLEFIFDLPYEEFSKIEGKRLVGSAIRICKAINKLEHAHTFNQIVEGCFTPDPHQDPKDSRRILFGLHVEPSKGGIQCNCCENSE